MERRGVSVYARCSFAAVLVAAAFMPGCDKRSAPSQESQETPAPSASVAQIGVALGSCSDLAACEVDCADGSADRCRRLAATYAMGRKAERNEARATELYVRACDLKDAPACMFAGQMHEFGRGVAKDHAAAAGFYTRSCEMGYLPGCYNEAIVLENGRGVATDRAKAIGLYDRICEAGAKPGCERAGALRGPPAAP